MVRTLRRHKTDFSRRVNSPNQGLNELESIVELTRVKCMVSTLSET